mmetsp:Transcript_4270/g.9202  ORF Transcript_4270/g.9202 Transcript_4270/m.9202 type:complete len:802 (+) Transcript_4270:255-2660(+)
MASLQSALKFLSLPNACPLSIIALDPATGKPLAVNSAFESIFGPFYKFKEWEFGDAATEDDDGGSNRTRFRGAIQVVCDSLLKHNGDDDVGAAVLGNTNGNGNGNIRNVEMLTLGTNEAGLPVRKYFDWSIGWVKLDSEEDKMNAAVMLYGTLVNEVESTNRARDAELIDFFQNAPIAMHWLNGDGTILWANQTEMNVLGYTAEEYIGQPIMNFCPDEKELVLEIFKQLGSGKTIKDVPVRFTTKDSKIVHLLIDSNVAYNKDGSFGHTRCFIRDDTARKIQDSRVQVLLDENERSLRMLDNFLSRTLHHVMGPLHALRATCDLICDRLQTSTPHYIDYTNKENLENADLLQRASDTISGSARMIADVSDLARFDEGAMLRTKFTSFDLRKLGIEAIEKIKFKDLRFNGGDDGITVSVKFLGGGGPDTLNTDRQVLLRVLDHLLENAVREADPGGNIHLQITSFPPSATTNSVGPVLVEVLDDGKGLPPGTCLDATNDAIGPVRVGSHRYNIGKRGNQDDPDKLQKARTDMEEGLRNLKQNGVGVGLPLSYHLVRMLGGDLRHDAEFLGGTRIWFTLPNAIGDIDDQYDVLQTDQIFKKGLPPAQISFVENGGESSRKRMRDDDAHFGYFVSSDSSAATSVELDDITEAPTIDTTPQPAAVAKCGVKAQMPFSVLIVEDTDICARLLGMQLKKMKCSTQRAENGQVALDILKNSMPGQFDLILMDLRMPVMDGLEATKLIREELKMIDIPILALTGEKRDDIQSECAGIGFTDFFAKPLPKAKLDEMIKKYKALRDGVGTS